METQSLPSGAAANPGRAGLVSNLGREIWCGYDIRYRKRDLAGPPLITIFSVDRLENLGVVAGYTAVVDHAQLGRPLQAFCELRFAGNTKVADIAGVAAGIPEVEAVYTTAGDPDALVLIRVQNLADLTRVIDLLRRSGRVTGTKTLMVLDVWRRAAV